MTTLSPAKSSDQINDDPNVKLRDDGSDDRDTFGEAACDITMSMVVQ